MTPKQRYSKSTKGRLAQARYDASEKGRVRRKKYQASSKGREVKSQYDKSTKGRTKNLEKRLRYRAEVLGLTTSDLAAHMMLQDYRCAICDSEFKAERDAHIDHDHQTNRFRGFLCGSCNRGLGLFKDNIQYLEQAKTYLSPLSSVS